RRVGIHGFGRVVRALLPRLRAFGVELAAYSAGVPAAACAKAGVNPCTSLQALFAQSGGLLECEGLTPPTPGSGKAKGLAALPDGAVFVNVARGQLVDESALLRETQSGRLRVALDVMTTESLATRRDAFGAAGAILSPHIAGPTLDQYALCGEFALRNLAR